MAGLVGLNDVRAMVQAAVGTRNKTWKDSMWSDFVKDVVSFLVDENSEDPDSVVEAAVGLIVYGATTKVKLQGVADNKEEFKRQLAEEGVPKAICDMLFAQYVAPTKGEPKIPDRFRFRRQGQGGQATRSSHSPSPSPKWSPSASTTR